MYIFKYLFTLGVKLKFPFFFVPIYTSLSLSTNLNPNLFQIWREDRPAPPSSKPRPLSPSKKPRQPSFSRENTASSSSTPRRQCLLQLIFSVDLISTFDSGFCCLDCSRQIVVIPPRVFGGGLQFFTQSLYFLDLDHVSYNIS